MATSRLPIEVCERIIDRWSCAPATEWPDPFPSLWPDYYAALRACCLTCRAWLARSRLNLYHTVLFRDGSQVYSLIATFAAHPHLAEHVRALWVLHEPRDESPSAADQVNSYIPFAHNDLVGRLRNVRTLSLCTLDWCLYPPRSHLAIARYPITVLRLETEWWALGDVFRLLCAVGRLEGLDLVILDIPGTKPLLPRWDASPLALSEAAKARATYPEIQRVRLEARCPMEGEGFPRLYALGNSITDFTFKMPCFRYYTDTADAGFRQLEDQISSLPCLERLTMSLEGQTAYLLAQCNRYTSWLADALSRSRASATLRHLGLHFSWPIASQLPPPYGVAVELLLKSACTPRMKDVLPELHTLRTLSISITRVGEPTVEPSERCEAMVRESFLELKADIVVLLGLKIAQRLEY